MLRGWGPCTSTLVSLCILLNVARVPGHGVIIELADGRVSVEMLPVWPIKLEPASGCATSTPALTST